jgi:ribosomal protein S1
MVVSEKLKQINQLKSYFNHKNKIMWKHKKTISDGQTFEINGINIWDFKWESTGKKTNVKDPIYGKAYSFEIYKIENNNSEIQFVAGEFTNCVWGIYQFSL